MAINPNIALAGQPLDLGATIQGALVNRGEARTQGVREQILNQQAQAGEVSAAQTQGAYMNQLATGLKGLPLDQRAAVVAQQMPLMTQMGFDPSQILSQDLSDTGLDQAITGTQMFVTPQGGAAGGQGGFQFGATQTVQKEDGSLVSITQVRDPNTGGVSVVETPIQGQLVSGIGETAGARQAREVETAVQKVTGTGGAETTVLEEREEVLRPGQVQTAEQLTAVDVSAAGQKQAESIRQQRASARKTQFSDQRQIAAAALPRLTEAFKLAEVADQGLTGRGKLLLSRLPGMEGIDVTDSAALDSALTNLALAELQKFKGPTTDFEFGVTQNIVGSLIGSQAANLARIAALQRNNWFLGREAEQFNTWTDQGGDPDRFTFNFEEVVNTGKGDYTLRQIQDTAVSNSMTIEQVLEALK